MSIKSEIKRGNLYVVSTKDAWVTAFAGHQSHHLRSGEILLFMNDGTEEIVKALTRFGYLTISNHHLWKLSSV